MLFTNLYVLGTTPVSLIMDIFRQVFFFIDSIIYSLIPIIYSIIFSLYDLSTLFGDSTKLSEIVKNLSTTIYSFLAIFMFFKSAFSLIMMLIDPARIDDKEQGAKKMIVNIFLCLVLIVAVPVGFNAAKKLQARIMENNIIEKMVIGEDFGKNGKDYNLGDEFAFSTWGVFLAKVDSNNSASYNKAYDVVFNSNSDARVQTALSDLGKELNSTNSKVGFLAKIPGISAVVNLTGTHYNLSYMWLLSTIAGVYVLWTFIKLMMDIAYRSIKFFMLELISPMAIISYIDPNSSKKGLFSKWLKATFSTYVSLFVRVFVFALAAVLLKSFSLSDIGTTNGILLKTGNTVVVKVFYIIALCAFMKNAPKFIDDLFGTSMSKESDVKVGRQMFAGLLGGGVSMAAGSISGAVAAARTGKSAFKGAVAGAWTGGKKGFEAGKKGGMVGVVSSGIGTVADQNKKYGLEVDRERDKLINELEGKVPAVNKAKEAAVKQLDMDQLLEKGAKYNGRKYGKGLAGDAKLENTIKKNAGGLARDELLHEDDAEYLRLRRLVYDQKNGEAIAVRTLELAKDDFTTNTDAYNASTDKLHYVTSFAKDTIKKRYSELNADGLRKEFETQLQKAEQTNANIKMNAFASGDRSSKIDALVNEAGFDRNRASGMTEVDLGQAYAKYLQDAAKSSMTAKITLYNNSSADRRVEIATDQATQNVSYEVSGMSSAQLDSKFTALNAERIEVTYGNSFGNIQSDAAKAEGDAKNAQAGLDDYIKTKGKKVKDIDSAFAIADNRYKAKELEEKRRQQQNQNNNNNNGGTP